jgi:hypothetical protein
VALSSADDSPGTRGRIVERPEQKLREPGRLNGTIDALPDGEHQHQRFEMHPAGHEGQHIAGWAVEPMCIVGDEQQRNGLRSLHQEIQCRQSNQERSGATVSLKPKARPANLP